MKFADIAWISLLALLVMITGVVFMFLDEPEVDPVIIMLAGIGLAVLGTKEK